MRCEHWCAYVAVKGAWPRSLSDMPSFKKSAKQIADPDWEIAFTFLQDCGYQDCLRNWIVQLLSTTVWWKNKSLNALHLSIYFGHKTNLLYEEQSFGFWVAFSGLRKAKCASLACGAVWGISCTVSDASELAVGCDARVKFGRTLFYFFVKLICISHLQCIMQKIIW